MNTMTHARSISRLLGIPVAIALAIGVATAPASATIPSDISNLYLWVHAEDAETSGIPSLDGQTVTFLPDRSTSNIDLDNPDKDITFDMIKPSWSDRYSLSHMVSTGVGPTNIFIQRHATWGMKLREIWNNPSMERSPMNYFQGALQLTGRKDPEGNLIYRYVGLKRGYRSVGWNTSDRAKEPAAGKSA